MAEYKIAHGTPVQYVTVEATSMTDAITKSGVPDSTISKCFKLNPTGERQAAKDAASEKVGGSE